jgi:hypothetical protein
MISWNGDGLTMGAFTAKEQGFQSYLRTNPWWASMRLEIAFPSSNDAGVTYVAGTLDPTFEIDIVREALRGWAKLFPKQFFARVAGIGRNFVMVGGFRNKDEARAAQILNFNNPGPTQYDMVIPVSTNVRTGKVDFTRKASKIDITASEFAAGGAAPGISLQLSRQLSANGPIAFVELSSNVDVRSNALIWFQQQATCAAISSLAELNSSSCWVIQLNIRSLNGWVNAGWGELIQRAGSTLVYSGDTAKFGADIAAARSLGIRVQRIGGGGSASWSMLVSRVPVANYQVAFGSAVPVAGGITVGQRQIPVNSAGGTLPATGAGQPQSTVQGATAPIGARAPAGVSAGLKSWSTPLLIAGGLVVAGLVMSQG